MTVSGWFSVVLRNMFSPRSERPYKVLGNGERIEACQ